MYAHGGFFLIYKIFNSDDHVILLVVFETFSRKYTQTKTDIIAIRNECSNTQTGSGENEFAGQYPHQMHHLAYHYDGR